MRFTPATPRYCMPSVCDDRYHMRIIHRIAFWYDERVERLKDIGVNCPRTPVGMGRDMLVLDVDEADPKWPAIKAVLDVWSMSTAVRTEFSRNELRCAQWLKLDPSWHHGYPMPDGDFGYLNLTYDLAEYCKKCGMGARQKAPFRMRGEPKWGRRSLLQLNWVFDEYFATPAVWKSVFAPLGIGCWPVLAYKKETELKTVVQLRIDTVLDAALAMGDQPFDICEFCQRKKYLPFERGTFPAMTGSVEGVHAIKTREYFGGGGIEAFREVLVSRDLFQRIRGCGLKGARFSVVGSL